MDEPRRQRLAVTGMTCTHCEIAVERALGKVPGLSAIRVDHRRGVAEFNAAADVDPAVLRATLAEEGYGVADSPARPANEAPRLSDYAEILAAFAILFGLYVALKQVRLLPESVTVLDQMSFGFIFLIGLVASVSSCMAVTGGLLVAATARYSEANPDAGARRRVMPLLAFNLARLISYTVLGAAIGALGATLTLSPTTTGVLTLVASGVMILLGLQMLHVLPALRFLPAGLSKRLGHAVHDMSARNATGGAALLGAATFFLPCGFTQALQLYVLAKASASVGAITMFAFALGTLPALLSLSALSGFATGAFQRRFVRFAGAAVILLGILNVQYGLVLSGSGFVAGPQTAEAAATQATSGAVQVVDMRVIDFGYEPYQFTVKQGVPVEWRIDAAEAAGCGRMLIAPRLGVRRILSAKGITTITFTPTQTGDFAFNCGMGMMTPDAKFTVVPAS